MISAVCLKDDTGRGAGGEFQPISLDLPTVVPGGQL
jgi:hypothetical protein